MTRFEKKDYVCLICFNNAVCVDNVVHCNNCKKDLNEKEFTTFIFVIPNIENFKNLTK